MAPTSPATVLADDVDVSEHWAPSTRNLVDELPPLIERMRGTGFDVFRVMFNLSDWDDTPRRSAFDGHTVKFGGFTTQHHNVVTLVDISGDKRREVINDVP